MELEGSFNHSTAVDLAFTSDAQKGSVAKTVAKIPPVLSGMDKAEALAFVSRLFDAAQAGAVLWGDELLLKCFLEQCSRTGSQETIDGYARELRHFVRWRDQRHPHLRLRELVPSLVDDWVPPAAYQHPSGASLLTPGGLLLFPFVEGLLKVCHCLFQGFAPPCDVKLPLMSF